LLQIARGAVPAAPAFTDFARTATMSQIDGKTSEGKTAGRTVERRKRNIPVAKERRNEKATAPKPVADSELSDDALEFMKAMDQYKRDNRRPFPTWSEVLEVLSSLGYRKVEKPTEIPRTSPPTLPLKG
jgi:hypothetical protein